MRKILAGTTAAALIMAAGSAHAFPDTVRKAPSQSQGFGQGQILIVGGVVVLGAIFAASAGGDDERRQSGPAFEGPDMDAVLAAAGRNRQASQDDIEKTEASSFFRKNPGLVSGNFGNRIALGLTGKGVSVGVMDHGIQRDNPGLAGASFGSGFLAKDLGDKAVGNYGLTHGTIVAQAIAGSHGDVRGVAPGVTLHDISYLRDRNGSLYSYEDDLAAAFRHVAKHEIDIVNLSMLATRGGAERDLRGAAEALFPGKTLNAVSDATRSGTIFVVAAGNYSKPGTDNAYAGIGLIEDVAKGQFVTVTALNEKGDDLAGFSNGCGQAMNYCISAVGQNIPGVGMSGEELRFNGTSLSTPIVTGALALLKEQFPELGSAELAELIFVTADDLGARGIDPKFGRGRLNMNNAARPVGDLRIVSGETVGSASTSVMEIGGATAGMMEVVRTDVAVLDELNRAFMVSPEDAFAGSGREDPIVEGEVSGTFRGLEWRATSDGGVWVSQRDGFGAGMISPELVTGQEGMVSRRGYAPVGVIGEAAVLSFRNGPLSVMAAREGSSYALSAHYGTSEGARYGFGMVEEKNGLLGSSMGSGESRTWFVSAGIHDVTAGKVRISAEATIASSEYASDAGIVRGADVMSASARAAVSFDMVGGEFTASVGAPLTAYSGTAIVDAPIGREPSAGDPTEGVERARYSGDFSAGFPYDIGASYEREFGAGKIKVSAIRRMQPEGDDESFFGLSLSRRF